MDRLREENNNSIKDWNTRWSNFITNNPDKFSRAYLDWQIKLMSKCSSILNVGCGLDNLSSCLPDKVICMDISEVALDFQRKYTRSVLKLDNVYQMNFGDSIFECVLASHVIEHLERPVDALQEWIRIASKIVVLLMPHDKYLNANIEHIWKITHDDMVHLGLLFGEKVSFYQGGMKEIFCVIDVRKDAKINL